MCNLLIQCSSFVEHLKKGIHVSYLCVYLTMHYYLKLYSKLDTKNNTCILILKRRYSS